MACVPGLARPVTTHVSPRQVIENLHTVFTDVLKNSATLGYRGRCDRLRPAIESAFDLAFMARGAVGRRWRKLSDEEQKRWVEAFGKFTVANYAGRMNHYSGQTFEILGEEDGTNATRVVRTRVVDPQGENVDLTYRLRQTDSGWRVIDIYAKGTISELALRRSEYAAVLKKEGFPALLAKVAARIEDLAKP